MISVLADFYRYEYRQEFEAGNNEQEREIDEGMGNRRRNGRDDRI